MPSQRSRAVASSIAAVATLCVTTGCSDSIKTAFQECTVGVSQSLAGVRDDFERRKQEILIASSCMHERGLVFDADRQRQDVTLRTQREPYVYWRRR